MPDLPVRPVLKIKRCELLRYCDSRPGIDTVLEHMCRIVLEVIFSLDVHRQPGEDSKMLVCDACDKGYHTFCLQPAMDSLPSDPWKCRVGHMYFHLGGGLSCPIFVCKPVNIRFETDISSQKSLSLSGHFKMSFSDHLLKMCSISEVSCLYGLWRAGTGTSRFSPVV